MPKTPFATPPALRTSHWTAETARAVLAAQRQSGECLTLFARQHGLQPQRLFWWRKRLGEEGAAAERPLLVPVITRPAVPAPQGGGSALQVRVGGVQLQFADAAALPPSWLAALVRALDVQR